MFKNLLANLGLGQSDLIHVFEETLKRVNGRDISTPEMRRGEAIAMLEMMNVLRDEDVMSNETYKSLTQKLIQWQNQ
jgi:hypothetical protein